MVLSGIGVALQRGRIVVAQGRLTPSGAAPQAPNGPHTGAGPARRIRCERVQASLVPHVSRRSRPT
ncbi:hypothetical protein I552_3913, partial [Mycobacterium xenopi 3993]